MTKLKLSLEEKFWKKVDKGGEGDCWLWTGSDNGKGGYGRMGIDGKAKSAHRISWELHNEKIPEGMHVLHHCDVRNCVNPAHLYIGTHQDNVNDRIRRGRQLRGENHGSSKLTSKDVAEIRRLYATGVLSPKHIGGMFLVSGGHVSCIAKGKYWQTTQRN